MMFASVSLSCVSLSLSCHLRGFELRLERVYLVLQLLPQVADVLHTRLQKRAHLLLRAGVLSLEGRQRFLGVFLEKKKQN